MENEFTRQLINREIVDAYVDKEVVYLMLSSGAQVTIRGLVAIEPSNRPEPHNHCRVVYEEPTKPRFAVHYEPPGSGVCVLDRFHTEEEAINYIAGLENKDFVQIIKEARK